MNKKLFLTLVILIIIKLTYSLSIKERNVLNVFINSNDELLVKGEPLHIDSLCDRVKVFILNPENDYVYSEKRESEIKHLGIVMVSKGIVSVQCERNTTYEFYIKVQNEIEKAYNELRNEYSIEKFGKEYKLIAKKYKKAINEYFPKIISEAEPNYAWKNGKLVKNYYTY